MTEWKRFRDALVAGTFAAGALIAREAGARVGDLTGGPARPGSVLAAHPDLFDGMVALLADLDVADVLGDLLDDAEHVLDVVRRFKSLGVCLSIDDFGTGYSSLAYLKRFPIGEK